ncbi:hypothetical protein JMUB7518_27920 [Staphylococcus aureus]
MKSKVASIAKSTLDLMSRTDLIEDKQQKVSSKTVTTSVSYTHLTLPTN